MYRSARTHTHKYTYECFRSPSLPLSFLFWSLIIFPFIVYLAPVVIFYPDTVFYLCGGFRLFTDLFMHLDNPSGYAVSCVGLRLFACCDCGFISYRGHGYVCLLSVGVVRQRSLCRANDSSRGVLPRVSCLSVNAKPRKGRL